MCSVVITFPSCSVNTSDSVRRSKQWYRSPTDVPQMVQVNPESFIITYLRFHSTAGGAHGLSQPPSRPERSPATRTTCLPLRARGTPLSNRHGLLPCRVAAPPAPASRTVVVGCTSAVQAEFHGGWQCWLLSGKAGRFVYPFPGRGSRRSKSLFSSKQPNLRLVAVAWSAVDMGLDQRCGLARRDDNAIVWAMHQLCPEAFVSKSSASGAPLGSRKGSKNCCRSRRRNEIGCSTQSRFRRTLTSLN